MLNTMFKKIKKVKKIIDYIAIVGVFYILLYQFEQTRLLCKGMCIYLIDWFLPITILQVKNLYVHGERLFQIVIIISVVTTFFSTLISFCDEYSTKHINGNSRFEKSLFRYLHDKSIPRCFLVTGQWGSGKSYEVNSFFSKYYQYTKTKVYRISCFGLSSRKELIDEINSIIEQQDQSYYAQIIKAIQFIPVIGEALNKFLKKDYGYENIKEGSIFIFDDFERISSCIVRENSSKYLYRPSPFLLNKTRGRGQLQEFSEIKKEFDSIENSFQEVENAVSQYFIKTDYEKYISLIGLINELVEIYRMKVIVICNTDILGNKFTHDILRSKLNCIEYKKFVTNEAKESIINDLIETKVISDVKKQECIHQYLNLLIEEMSTIEWDPIFKDLRLFGGVLEAFIDTAILFRSEVLSLNFLNSLLNSVLVVHCGYYKNNIQTLDVYVTGVNIEFMLRLFRGPLDASHLVKLASISEDAKWIDIDISGYWIFNFTLIDNLEDIFQKWKIYDFAELESSMIKDVQALMKATNCDFLHVLFYLKKYDNKDKVIEKLTPFIAPSLSRYNLEDKEVVETLLTFMNTVLEGTITMDFNKQFFKELSKYNSYGTVSHNTFTHEEYNRFLNDRTERD